MAISFFAIDVQSIGMRNNTARPTPGLHPFWDIASPKRHSKYDATALPQKFGGPPASRRAGALRLVFRRLSSYLTANSRNID
jgi:hypothetical protein